MATTALAVQNWYESTLSGGINASDTTIGLNAVPTGTEGYLIIEPDSSTNREVIYYTSKTSNSVLLPSAGAGRGLDGTTAQSHSSGATVRMEITSSHWNALKDGTAFNGSGHCVQMAKTTTSAVATGTTVIPYDDTIPQNTEGDQYLSLTYTPKSASNRLVIESVVNLSNSNGTITGISALFQDSTADALAANCFFMLTATAQIQIKVVHEMAAGTTSPTTFKIRAGFSGAGTTTLNGQSGARRFGGTSYSYLIVREYIP